MNRYCPLCGEILEFMTVVEKQHSRFSGTSEGVVPYSTVLSNTDPCDEMPMDRVITATPEGGGKSAYFFAKDFRKYGKGDVFPADDGVSYRRNISPLGRVYELAPHQLMCSGFSAFICHGPKVTPPDFSAMNGDIMDCMMLWRERTGEDCAIEWETVEECLLDYGREATESAIRKMAIRHGRGKLDMNKNINGYLRTVALGEWRRTHG